MAVGSYYPQKLDYIFSYAKSSEKNINFEYLKKFVGFNYIEFDIYKIFIYQW